VQTGLRMAEMDPRLVRLISRRFSDLAGLRTALIGMLVMGLSGMWLWTRNGEATLLGLLVLVLLAVYPLHRIQRYYREQFGRVERRDNTSGLFVVLAWFSGFFAIRPESAWLYWAFMSAYSVWALYDGWPYRRHELFVIAACACAAVLPSRNTGEADLGPGLFLVGFAYVICGWADHKLLVRALNQSANVLSNTADSIASGDHAHTN
jgi:drug/metabolite transporter superfamily protein YnfA